jgi:hypothetical protein
MRWPAALALALAACVPPPPAPLPAPTLAAWRQGRETLEALRRATSGARTERIALTIREPRTGRIFTARGAAAILPPRALRMILLGPGGTTALDLWIDGDRWRFAVPALDLVKRGDLRAPPEQRRGLPVDFLAWWLLRPASGKLLWHARADGCDRFVLRDGAAVVDLRAGDDGRVEAQRSAWSTGEGGPHRVDEETVSAPRLDCAPGAGPVRYHQASTGLDVTVTCEGRAEGDPPARALVDPDGPP